jgi:hypothetical protein
MPRFDESIRPIILDDMRADGVRSLDCQVFSFEHQAFPARARQPKRENPSRRRFLARKAPAGATDMSITIGARERFECEVVHIPSNAFCQFRCLVCDSGNMRANGVHWAWISAVCTAVVQTGGRRWGVLSLIDLAGLPCRDAIGVR